MKTAEIELAEDAVERRWADVLDALANKRAYGLAPWNPLDGEGRLAFCAFCAFRDSPQRNLGSVAAQLSLKYRDVKDLAHLYQWQQRAEMFDQWTERCADDARAELVARTAADTAAAFSRLPALAMGAMQLFEGAVNAELAKQAKLAEGDKSLDPDDYAEDAVVKPTSLTMGMNLANTAKGLLDSATKFLTAGKLTIEHNHRGTITQAHELTVIDAIGYMQGLADANFDVEPIETTAIEAGNG